MDKIRVLQFPISANNGVKTYALNNWKHLNKSKFSCDFAIVRPNLCFEKEFVGEGAGVKYLLASPDRERKQYIEDIRTLLLGNYDVVHLHTSYWKRLLIEQIAMECRIPKVIVHSHNTQIDMEDEKKRKRAEEVHWKLRNEFNTSLATDFCACSQQAADWLFGPQISRDRIRILRNAIEVEKYSFNQQIRDEYRKKLGIENNFVIGHVGRFSAQKNHDFLVDVFAEITRQVSNVKLLLAGEGPLEDRIKGKVKDLNLSDKILFLGQRNDIPQLLQAMDAFCLPSKFEGLGIVLIEAQAAGLPCIVSDYIPKEALILTDSIISLQLAYEDWISAIMKILYKKSYRQICTKNFILSGYDLADSIRCIEELYYL